MERKVKLRSAALQSASTLCQLCARTALGEAVSSTSLSHVASLLEKRPLKLSWYLDRVRRAAVLTVHPLRANQALLRSSSATSLLA